MKLRTDNQTEQHPTRQRYGGSKWWLVEKQAVMIALLGSQGKFLSPVPNPESLLPMPS